MCASVAACRSAPSECSPVLDHFRPHGLGGQRGLGAVAARRSSTAPAGKDSDGTKARLVLPYRLRREPHIARRPSLTGWPASGAGSGPYDRGCDLVAAELAGILGLCRHSAQSLTATSSVGPGGQPGVMADRPHACAYPDRQLRLAARRVHARRLRARDRRVRRARQRVVRRRRRRSRCGGGVGRDSTPSAAS